MALSIRSAQADRLARELARETGESLTEAIVVSLQDRLDRIRHDSDSSAKLKRLRRLQYRASTLPIADERPADEIVGYDDNGIPS